MSETLSSIREILNAMSPLISAWSVYFLAYLAITTFEAHDIKAMYTPVF